MLASRRNQTSVLLDGSVALASISPVLMVFHPAPSLRSFHRLTVPSSTAMYAMLSRKSARPARSPGDIDEMSKWIVAALAGPGIRCVRVFFAWKRSSVTEAVLRTRPPSGAKEKAEVSGLWFHSH